jgi:hypothetical protein
MAIARYERGMMLDLNDFTHRQLVLVFTKKARGGTNDESRAQTALQKRGCLRTCSGAAPRTSGCARLLGVAFDLTSFDKARDIAEQVEREGADVDAQYDHRKPHGERATSARCGREGRLLAVVEQLSRLISAKP